MIFIVLYISRGQSVIGYTGSGAYPDRALRFMQSGISSCECIRVRYYYTGRKPFMYNTY